MENQPYKQYSLKQIKDNIKNINSFITSFFANIPFSQKDVNIDTEMLYSLIEEIEHYRDDALMHKNEG